MNPALGELRWPASPSAPYFGQLDALRAVAVFCVLVEHFTHSRLLHRFLPWGQVGVWLFFVLSGFLITRILLPLADDQPARGDRLFSMRRFYLRRALRIAPAYYLTVALVVLLGLLVPGESVGWHLLYLSNFYFEATGWQSQVSHFWSLALEEQFYLLWAPLILLIPGTWRKKMIFGLIAVAVLSRLYVRSFPEGSLRVALTFFYAVDALCIGALLAQHDDLPRWLRRPWQWAAPLGLAALLVLRYLGLAEDLVFVLLPLGLALAFAQVVAAAADGMSGWPGRLLENPVLGYLGRISYGIYLYHALVPLVVLPLVPDFYRRLPAVPGAAFVFFSATTLGLAVLSWHLVEKPIHRLRNRFGYRRPAA